MHIVEKWYSLHTNLILLFVMYCRELTASDLRKKLIIKGVNEDAAHEAVAYLEKK